MYAANALGRMVVGLVAAGTLVNPQSSVAQTDSVYVCPTVRKSVGGAWWQDVDVWNDDGQETLLGHIEAIVDDLADDPFLNDQANLQISPVFLRRARVIGWALQEFTATPKKAARIVVEILRVD